MTAPPVAAAAIAAARDSAKAYLRVEGDAENAAIERFAAAGFGLAEAFTGCALIARDWEDELPADRRWARLTPGPVAAIVAVGGSDAAGEAVALDPAQYAIDIDAQGDGWVRGGAPGVARLQVRYRAGLAESWEALPAPIAQGLVLIVAHWFDARTAVLAPLAAVTALWRPWRRVRLAVRAA